MASQFLDLPLSSGGGGGAVSSVNGQTGAVNLSATDVGAATQQLDNLASPVLNTAIDAGGYNLFNMTDPTNPQDAATKAYVDAQSGGGSFPILLPNSMASAPSLALVANSGTGIYNDGSFPNNIYFSFGGSGNLVFGPAGIFSTGVTPLSLADSSNYFDMSWITTMNTKEIYARTGARVRLFEASDTYQVALRANPAATESYQILFPPTPGNVGETMITDGAGDLHFGTPNLAWKKYSFNYTQFSVAGITQTINVAAIPAGYAITALVLRLTSTFAASGLATANIDVGNDLTSANAYTSYNALTTTSGTSFSVSSTNLGPVNFTGSQEITVTVSADVNLNTLTDGEFDILVQLQKINY